MKRTILSLLGVGLLFGCSDSASRSGLAPLGGRSVNEISEGRFGGNPDFFFAAPLATTPQPGDLNFEVGRANGALVPYLRVCETNGASGPAGCVTDVTLQVTGSATGLAMTYNATAEQYQVNWQTKDLVVGTNYRIEVWGLAISSAAEKLSTDPRWRFGWIDVSNAPSVSSCTGEGEYCLIKYGQTLPVKVRIEQSVFCPVTRNCAVQFVSEGNDAVLQATLDDGSGAPSAQLFIPAQDGTNFAIAFEPCTAEENAAVSDAVDIPTFGPCLRTNTPFSSELQVPAIVSLCSELDASSFGLTDEQEHQLALHHLTNDLSRVTALPEAFNCAPPSSGAALPGTNTLMRLALAARSRLAALVTPRVLYAASAKRIDRGGGGATNFVSSFFKLALPSKFEYVIASDATQTRLAGATHTLQAKVTDLFGEPVANARVRWSVAGSPAPGASLQSPTPQLTDASGIATATVQLSSSPGLNIFHASGRGIAASGSECATPSPTTLSCNGPRATFDPFTALKVPETDALGDELPVDFAEGTRLPFSIFGCAPGYGTATVDGTLSATEWECARTYSFTANVSGGATPATLYVMNDGSRLFLAVRLQRSASDKVNKLQFNFDNNNSWATNGTGAAEAGDDILSFDSATGLIDAFLTGKCANSSQSSCWSTDASDGGTGEGSGAFTNAGGFTTYEISHPLNTVDNAHDFSLSAGSKAGLFLTLQTGAGAAGNTQWPGFRQYREITIVP